MDMLDRVFGSCFRSWAVRKENVGEGKYIDYLPTRKWKYSDHNLMKDLSENNGCDVIDLADDTQGQTPSNIKLRLHDNVFISPLNYPIPHVVNESTESEEIIMEIGVSHVAEENNNTTTGDYSLDEVPNVEIILSQGDDKPTGNCEPVNSEIEVEPKPPEICNGVCLPDDAEDGKTAAIDSDICCVQNGEATEQDISNTEYCSRDKDEREPEKSNDDSLPEDRKEPVS